MKTLDTNLSIAVPEYIVFHRHIAGPVVRLLALLTDIVIIILSIIFAFIVFAIIGSLSFMKDLQGFPQFLLLLFLFLINWFYFYLFERYNRGRTPGKMLFSIRVMSRDGGSLDSSQLLIRNLLRIADMFPFLSLGIFFVPSYCLGALSCFVSGRAFQRLGDLAGGTIVVREFRNRRSSDSFRKAEDEIVSIANKLHMRITPSPSLIQGLNDFASRSRTLSTDRSREIAKSAEKMICRCFGCAPGTYDPVNLLLAAHHYLFERHREIKANIIESTRL